MEKFVFEDGLERLSEIIDSIEEGETPLAAALELYKEGVALISDCADFLNQSEQDVMILEELEGMVKLTKWGEISDSDD